MGDSGEGLVDADARIQERIEERESERKRRGAAQPAINPDKVRELESLRLANLNDCVKCIENHRDVLVGVKIRLSDSIAAEGRNEHAAHERLGPAAGGRALGSVLPRRGAEQLERHLKEWVATRVAFGL